MSFPFAQLTANSLIIGSIYALVASGFSLIYSANRFMHFAHGTSVAASGYILYSLFSLLQIPLWIAAPLTIALAALLGVGMHKLLYEPLKNKNSSSVVLLLASIGLLILFENLILATYGASVKSIPAFTRTATSIAGANITYLQLTIIATTATLLTGLWTYMNKTRTGRDIRAVADNPQLAQIMGVDANKIKTLTFALGSALAGIAGILIGLEQNLTPNMGTNLMIKGFAGAVIGGITSVPASITGSYLVGFAENFGIWWLPSGFKDAITFGLLLLFLILKPNGLFGVDQGVRK